MCRHQSLQIQAISTGLQARRLIQDRSFQIPRLNLSLRNQENIPIILSHTHMDAGQDNRRGSFLAFIAHSNSPVDFSFIMPCVKFTHHQQ
jgi:hypothetical protein